MNAARANAAEANASSAKRARDYEVFRIQASDTNKFAIINDPLGEGTSFISVVEIFDVAGRTPPNRHAIADEMFYVLHGEGMASCAGKRVSVRKGDSFLVRSGHEHWVENIGRTRLYCLTVMAPNEGFAELIRGGVRDALDAADLAILADS